MNHHPLIDALNHASDSTARLCTNLKAQGYTLRDGIGRLDDAAMADRLVDSLSVDVFGVAQLNDRRTLDDRLASGKGKLNAKRREVWRADVRITLEHMPADMRRDLIDALARKGGAAFAKNLQDAADALLIATADQAIAEVATSQKVAA